MARYQRIPKQKFGPMGEKLCRHCEGEIVKGSGRRTFCSDQCVHEALLRSDGRYLRQQVELRDKGVCAECKCDTRALELEFTMLWRIAQMGFDASITLEAKIWTNLGVTRNRWMHVRGAKTPEQADAEIAAYRARLLEAFERNQKRLIEDERLRPLPHPDQDPAFKTQVARIKSQILVMMPAERHALNVQIRLRRLAAARFKRREQEIRKMGFKISYNQIDALWEADHINPVELGGGACGMEGMQTLCIPCHYKKNARQAAERAARKRAEQEVKAQT